jgi:hypothetical protein
MADAVLLEVDQDRTTRPELERGARALNLLTSTFLGAVFMGRDAAERTQVFRPNFTVNQRQLPPGPKGALPGGEPERPISADGPIEAGPAAQDQPAEDEAPEVDEDTARRSSTRNGAAVSSAKGSSGPASETNGTGANGVASTGSTSKGSTPEGSTPKGSARAEDAPGRSRRKDPGTGR